MHKYFLIFVFCFYSFSRCSAQGETWNWRFGRGAGINFPGGSTPITLSPGPMTVLEGSSSISDASGNLLFYTDGYTVWNKNDVQMANGTGLKGFVASGTQTSVIVKKPGANSIYYIFTLLFDLYYSEVDMSLDGGLGDVVVATKNTYLGQNGTEKVTAVKHCNNIDVWVIMPMSASNQFSVFLVTAAGVNPTPVFSTAGVTMVGARGQMKASPDGKKVGYVTLEGDYAEILDFDNSSGILSNPILIGPSSVYDQVYGCEFSPDNTKFYMNNTDVTNSAIWQFNLCAGNEASINASGLKIATAAGNSGQLQLAPDKKIYSARFGKAWLGVISSPNTTGVGCAYSDNGVFLGLAYSQYGLPNFVQGYFKQTLPEFTYSPSCLTSVFTAPTIGVTNCSGSLSAITSYLWDFGDPASGSNNNATNASPTHLFTSSGSYTVTLILGNGCGFDTLVQTITVFPCGGITASVNSAKKCGGSTSCPSLTVVGTSGTPPFTYLWSTGETASTINPCPLTTSSYTVTVTDNTGATVSTVSNIIVTNPITINITPLINCAGDGTTLTAHASGGTPGYTYLWNNTSTNATTTNLTVGNYTVTVTDANGCTSSQTSAVTTTVLVSATFTQSPPGDVCVGTLVNFKNTGSTGTYYSWNLVGYKFVTTVDFSYTFLTAGIYTLDHTVKIRDCSATVRSTINVKNCTTPTATTTGASVCSGKCATVTSSAIGGSNPYTYRWNTGEATQNINPCPVSTTTYTVTITDNGSTTSTSTAVVTVNPEININLTSANITCTGGKGSVTATGSGGTPNYTYLWSTGVTNTGASSQLTNLGANTYTVTVTDSKGCTTASTATVASTLLSGISTKGTANCSKCGCKEWIMVTGINGTPPYTYQWPDGYDKRYKNALCPGVYNVIVTDNNGCKTTVKVNAP